MHARAAKCGANAPRVLDSAWEPIYIRGMRSSDEHTRGLEDESYRELRFLEEVDSSPDLSQRQLARRLGIALGVANLLVHSLAGRGYIKVTHLSWRRWVYVVTPKGMRRKLQLTVAYIDRFFDHYRRVKHLLREDIGVLMLNKESRVAIVGTTELAELAFLVLRDLGVDEIEVFERNPTRHEFLGMRVQELGSIEPGEFAKVVIAVSSDADGSRNELYASGVSDSQVLELLRPVTSENGEDGRQEPE